MITKKQDSEIKEDVLRYYDAISIDYMEDDIFELLENMLKEDPNGFDDLFTEVLEIKYTDNILYTVRGKSLEQSKYLTVYDLGHSVYGIFTRHNSNRYPDVSSITLETDLEELVIKTVERSKKQIELMNDLDEFDNYDEYSWTIRRGEYTYYKFVNQVKEELEEDSTF